MRTTVTLDADVARMLREAAHHNHSSFKTALNAAVRAGLSKKPQTGSRRKFVVKARPMGLRSGIDPAGLNRLADELEVDEFLEKTRRLHQEPGQ